MFKGISDLGGIGKLFAEGRGFVMDLLRHLSERDNRKLRDAEQDLRNQQIRLRNQALNIKNQAAALRLAQSLLTVSKRSGRSPEELQGLVILLTSVPETTPVKQETNVLGEIRPKLIRE